MKRSEMVDLFADYLSGNYDEEWNNKKVHVSAILHYLEVLGMLPPRITEVSEERFRNLGENRWEPEDEA